MTLLQNIVDYISILPDADEALAYRLIEVRDFNELYNLVRSVLLKKKKEFKETGDMELQGKIAELEKLVLLITEYKDQLLENTEDDWFEDSEFI